MLVCRMCSLSPADAASWENRDSLQRQNTTFVQEWGEESIRSPSWKVSWKHERRSVPDLCTELCQNTDIHYTQTHILYKETHTHPGLNTCFDPLQILSKQRHNQTDTHSNPKSSHHKCTHALNNKHTSDSLIFQSGISVIKHRGMCAWSEKEETPYMLPVMPQSGLSGCRPRCVNVRWWQTANAGAYTLSKSRHAPAWHSLLSHGCEPAPKAAHHKSLWGKKIERKNKKTFFILGGDF